MKFKKSLPIIVLSLLLSSEGFALPKKVARGKGKVRKASSSTSNEKVMNASKGRDNSCKSNISDGGNGHIMSYDYLLAATHYHNSEADAVWYDKKENRVKVRKHLGACLDLASDYKRSGSDIFVTIKNKYDFKESRYEILNFLEKKKRYKKDKDKENWEKFEKMDNAKKYTVCLDANGLLNKDESINWAEAKKRDLIEDKATFKSHSMPSDKEESVRLFFASGQVGSEPDSENIADVSPNGLECRWFENFGRKPIDEDDSSKGTKSYFIRKSKDHEKIEKAYQACRNNDIDGMSNIIKSLTNFPELQGVLDESIYKLQREKAIRIKTEMEAILDKDKDIGRSDVRDYAKLSREMSRDVFNPIAERLEDLRKEYKSARKEKDKDNIRDRMEELQGILKEGHVTTAEIRPLYKAIRNDESLHRYGIKIEETKLEGEVFQHIGLKSESKKAIKLKHGKKLVKKHKTRFRKETLDDWACHAQSLKGSTKCARAIDRDIRRRQEYYAQKKRKYQKFVEQGNRYCQQARSNQWTIFGKSPAYECRKYKRSRKNRDQEMYRIGKQTSYFMRSTGERRNRYYANVDLFKQERQERRISAMRSGSYQFGLDPLSDDLNGDLYDDGSWMYDMGAPNFNFGGNSWRQGPQQIMGPGGGGGQNFQMQQMFPQQRGHTPYSPYQPFQQRPIFR